MFLEISDTDYVMAYNSFKDRCKSIFNKALEFRLEILDKQYFNCQFFFNSFPKVLNSASPTISQM